MARERNSNTSREASGDADHPFGRGTAWQTISEAKRQIRGSVSTYEPPSPAAGGRIKKGCTSRTGQMDGLPLSAHMGAAASPAELATDRGLCIGTGPEEHASPSPQSPWACAVCTRTNVAGAEHCNICGRSKDARLAGRVQRPGIISSNSPLLQKLKDFQKGSVRADKEVIRCEEFSREIQDVLSTLRGIKASPPNKKV
jgi:hypothetical protein